MSQCVLLVVGKVIGKKGSIIQSILEKSRVNNVKVVGDDQAKERNIDISTQVCYNHSSGVVVTPGPGSACSSHRRLK